MASFAKAQLLKYGWTEGKGLGKNESGITDPLKPKLKFDTTGIGHDSKEYNWWESVYDKAAKNIDVKTDEKQVSVGVKEKDAVRISTSRVDFAKLAESDDLCYGTFLKTCTLENGRVVSEETSTRDKILRDAPSFGLTDEELLAACGGRTAHKGARHGLSLGGKLARIAQQEAELLAKSENSTGNGAVDRWTEVKSGKRKSKRKRRRNTAETELDEGPSAIPLPLMDANANNVDPPQPLSGDPQISGTREQTKSAIRKEKRRFQSMVRKLGSVLISADESGNRTKKRKIGKDKNHESRRESCGETEQCGSAKKRKRKNGKRSELDPAAVAAAAAAAAAAENESGESAEPAIANTAESATDCSNVVALDDEEMIKQTKKRKKDLTEAERLNYRIDKTKQKRQAKKETRRVERLSESLMAVNLCEDSVDSGRGEDLIESCEVSRKLKKWKKKKKVKRDKNKTEESSTLDS